MVKGTRSPISPFEGDSVRLVYIVCTSFSLVYAKISFLLVDRTTNTKNVQHEYWSRMVLLIPKTGRVCEYANREATLNHT